MEIDKSRFKIVAFVYYWNVLHLWYAENTTIAIKRNLLLLSGLLNGSSGYFWNIHQKYPELQVSNNIDILFILAKCFHICGLVSYMVSKRFTFIHLNWYNTYKYWLQ